MRGSQLPPPYDKFARMRDFYAVFNKKWKDSVTASNARITIEKIEALRLPYDKKDPVIDEKLERVNAFYTYCATTGDMRSTLAEFEKSIKLSCPSTTV